MIDYIIIVIMSEGKQEIKEDGKLNLYGDIKTYLNLVKHNNNSIISISISDLLKEFDKTVETTDTQFFIFHCKLCKTEYLFKYPININFVIDTCNWFKETCICPDCFINVFDEFGNDYITVYQYTNNKFMNIFLGLLDNRTPQIQEDIKSVLAQIKFIYT